MLTGDQMRNEVIKYFLTSVPRDAAVTRIEYEGTKLAIYTKNPDLFSEQNQITRDLVNLIKKRVVIRSDPSIRLAPEDAEKEIREILPPELTVQIYFDETLGEVILETDRPEDLSPQDKGISQQIAKATRWKPRVLRAPAMESRYIQTVRQFLYGSPGDRASILRDVGERIFRTPVLDMGDIRITVLGGGQQVGRSAFLLETSESKVLIDCGISPGGKSGLNQFPRIDSRVIETLNLDAVVISHAHLDHCGFLPYLFKYDYDGPVFCLEPTATLMMMLQLDYIDVTGKEGAFAPYSEQDVRATLLHTIPMKYGTVTNITPDIRLTVYNAGHILGSAMLHLHIGEGYHNIVYSLDWSTPVVVIDPEGATRIIEIGRLVDGIMGRVEPTGDFVQRLGNFEGWKTIAFDPNTYEIREVPITSFLRHPISEELYEITTNSGKTAIVSGSHSVFKAENGQILPVPVRNLKPSDYVISARTVPRTKEAHSLVELPEDEFRVYLNDPAELASTLSRHEKLIQEICPSNKDEVLFWLRERFEKAEYRSNIARKHHAKPARVARIFGQLGVRDLPRLKTVLPKKFAITPDFARFIGYYLAEGSVNGNTVVITNDSRVVLRDCAKIIQPLFGCKPFQGNCEIRFPSKSLRQLLNRLGCGENAYTKRVPPILLSGPESIITELLKGYFVGDGSLRDRKTGWNISAGSKSRLLLEDFAFLLLCLGVPVSYQYNRSTEMNYINIYGIDQIEGFLKKVEIPAWVRKAKTLRRVIHKSALCDRVPTKTLTFPIQERIARTAYKNAKSVGVSKLQLVVGHTGGQTTEEVDQPFIYEEVKNIKKVKPTSRFVYDLSVEGFENFLGGHGFFFMHNTGDFKFEKTRLLDCCASRFHRVETLITESTYGATPIPFTRRETERLFSSYVEKAVQRGGKVLVPVPAIGRAQEILLVLEAMLSEKAIPEVPVFIDGLVNEATAIHTAYPQYLTAELQKAFEERSNPFASDYFTPVRTPSQREEATAIKGPAMIMSTSGMLEGGPVLGYFRELAEDENNLLAFVSYQVEGTMGRKLLKGIKDVSMTDENGKAKIVRTRMEVQKVDGFSGHSSRQQLVNYLRRIVSKPRNVIVCHGEPQAVESLARVAARILPAKIYVPRNLDTMALS